MPNSDSLPELATAPRAGWFAARFPSKQQAHLVLTLIICNLLVVAGGIAYLTISRASLELRAKADAENLTKLTAKNIESQIATIDLGLRMVVAEVEYGGGLERLPEPASMRRFNTATSATDTNSLPAMRTENAQGLILAGPGFDKNKPASVEGRDYFLALKETPSISFAVGESVLGKISKKWIVPFARPIRGPNGEFAGLITVSTPVELFQPQSLLNLHPDSLFLVMDSQRRVVSRVTKGGPQLDDFGKALTGPLAMTATASKKAFVPAAHYVSALDNIDRVMAAQRLDAPSWFVVVGLPWAAYEALWHRDVAGTFLMVLFFCLVSTGLAWFLRRGMARQEQDLSRIEFLAYHDVLTELPNRKLLNDRFSQASAHAKRVNQKLALLYLDLDHFKAINDSLGHATGDALLRETALRLKSSVRGTDTVSRQGGDEFLILLSELSLAEHATPAIAQIMERLQQPILIDGHELFVSTSVGIAVYPDDGLDFDTLRKKADVAMYKAKEQGRNGYCFFNDAMNASAHERLEMTNALKRALDRDEFILHYQPQVDLRTNRIVGVEALIRWNHPQFGMVPPGKFIPLAEQSGLIVPIGTWVLEEACRQSIQWQGLGLTPIPVAVNLSAVQFKRNDIEATIDRVLSESGLAPHLLELELTESILMTDTQEVLATARRLRAKGLQLSIDDFGTGYSCLAYLKSFKVDTLKIDQSFIRGITANLEDKAIIAATVRLARTLKLKTIAEGVETEAQFQRLKRMGCDIAQGYYIAKPMPADRLAEFHKEWGANA